MQWSTLEDGAAEATFQTFGRYGLVLEVVLGTEFSLQKGSVSKLSQKFTLTERLRNEEQLDLWALFSLFQRRCARAFLKKSEQFKKLTLMNGQCDSVAGWSRRLFFVKSSTLQCCQF